MGVTLIGVRRGIADWDKCYNKFQPVLGQYVVGRHNDGRMFCALPECPGSIDLNSNTLWENRYY
ncbi:MAG: hypothetical protein LBE99_00670 [Puniceicoccales bacterium]|nr:hypothetical protein [Puniceicoccales bacterium]